MAGSRVQCTIGGGNPSGEHGLWQGIAELLLQDPLLITAGKNSDQFLSGGTAVLLELKGKVKGNGCLCDIG